MNKTEQLSKLMKEIDYIEQLEKQIDKLSILSNCFNDSKCTFKIVGIGHSEYQANAGYEKHEMTDELKDIMANAIDKEYDTLKDEFKKLKEEWR
jgi:hypothetical protein